MKRIYKLVFSSFLISIAIYILMFSVVSKVVIKNKIATFDAFVGDVITIKELLVLQASVITSELNKIDGLMDITFESETAKTSQKIEHIGANGVTEPSGHVEMITRLMGGLAKNSNVTLSSNLFYRSYIDQTLSSYEVGFKEGTKLGDNFFITRCKETKSCSKDYDLAEVKGAIVSNIYRDMVTDQLNITLAAPVYYKGELIGDLSYDIFPTNRIPYLNDVNTYMLEEYGIRTIVFSNLPKSAIEPAYSRIYALNNNVLVSYTLGHHQLFKEYAAWLLFIFVVVYNLLAVIVGRKSLEVEKKLAKTDSLTGALNRTAFQSLAQYSNTDNYTVISIDGNGIKHINDTFGHSAGDKAIKKIAKTLKATVRKNDLVFRFGGDEFVVMLKHCPEDNAVTLMENVNKKLGEEPIVPDNYVNVSYGIAKVSDSDGLEDALKVADSNMYTHKRTYKR